MYEGTIAKKLGHLEGILKANNGGSGFFVGDGVCINHFKRTPWILCCRWPCLCVNWGHGRDQWSIFCHGIITVPLLSALHFASNQEVNLYSTRLCLGGGGLGYHTPLPLYFQVATVSAWFNLCPFFQVTWADLALIDVGSLMLKQYPTCFDKTPLVKALYDRVIALPRIKKHIETRPESGI